MLKAAGIRGYKRVQEGTRGYKRVGSLGVVDFLFEGQVKK
jgi:hypothetical protein